MKTSRMASLVLSASVSMLVLVGCEEGTEGPEAGASVEDVQDDLAGFQDDLTALDERLTALEDEVGAVEDTDAANDEDVLEDPASLVGHQVVVSAEVESVIDTQSFTLDGPQGPLLVVNATGSDNSDIVEDGAVVQVTGTVREGFNVTEAEQEFGLELDDGLFADFEDQHYIAADSVTEAPAEGDS